jgi:hypothetical protein
MTDDTTDGLGKDDADEAEDDDVLAPETDFGPDGNPVNGSE